MQHRRPGWKSQRDAPRFAAASKRGVMEFRKISALASISIGSAQASATGRVWRTNPHRRPRGGVVFILFRGVLFRRGCLGWNLAWIRIPDNKGTVPFCRKWFLGARLPWGCGAMVGSGLPGLALHGLPVLLREGAQLSAERGEERAGPADHHWEGKARVM